MEQTKQEWQSEALHELAREYFGSEFPPAGQTDCPPPAHLRAVAQIGRLPDDTLRAHLFGCSACFTEYRTALATRPVAVPAIAGQATAKFWRAWPAKFRAAVSQTSPLVWSVTALLLLSLSWWSWRNWHEASTPATTVSQSLPVITPAPPTPVAAKPALPPAPAERPKTPNQTAPPRAETKVPLDLNEFVALRDALTPSGPGVRSIVLPPLRTELQFRLPEGSLAGRYAVRLLDEHERVITEAAQNSRDGQRLNIVLDLQGLPAQTYHLELRQPGEPAALYVVQIAAQR